MPWFRVRAITEPYLHQSPRRFGSSVLLNLQILKLEPTISQTVDTGKCELFCASGENRAERHQIHD